MSANQDKSQKVTFVYSNLYALYKKGKEAANTAELSLKPEAASGVHPGLTRSSQVIKAGDRAQVKRYQPPSFLRPTPDVMHQARVRRNQEELKSLRANLEQLKDVHSRLKFLLGELQDFLKN